MSAASTISASTSLAREGTQVTIALGFSGVTGHPTISQVGWIGRPPFWDNLNNLLGLDPTTNAGFFTFNVVLECAGNPNSTSGSLVQQPIMPILQLSDGSQVIPSGNSSAPPVNPAYPTGKNPPVISVIPMAVTSAANTPGGPLGAPGTLNFSDSNNSALLAAI